MKPGIPADEAEIVFRKAVVQAKHPSMLTSILETVLMKLPRMEARDACVLVEKLPTPRWTGMGGWQFDASSPQAVQWSSGAGDGFLGCHSQEGRSSTPQHREVERSKG